MARPATLSARRPGRLSGQHDQRIWETPEELGSAIFEWIEAWYNPRRRHTSIGMLSPVDYEHHWQHQQVTADLHTAANGAA